MSLKSFALFAAFFLVPVSEVATGPAGSVFDPPATGWVEGTVTHADEGRPLSGAQVTVMSAGGLAVGSGQTNASGRYRIENVPVGVHEVSVRLVGFDPEIRQATVEDGAGTVVDFALQKTGIMLSRVTVTDKLIFAPQLNRPAAAAFAMRPLDRESYAYIEENGFRRVSSAPLSTFSIDVDRASYANVRRFLNDGARPPIDAVRIEEMINYFPYDEAQPSAEHPFAVETEVWSAPWQPRHRLVRIGLHAPSVDLGELPPSNLVFLLDVSGSMHSRDKLPLVKKSLQLLVEELRPEDRVAIVVYAGAAGLVLPSTPGNERKKILSAIEQLEAGGTTAGGAGLKLAYKVVRENYIDGGNNRVILATDGDFNVGPSSDGEMVRLIEKERESGSFLTVLGFGTGNLQDSKMEQIADHGNGNFHYIDGLLEAKKSLVEEMGGTLFTVAKDVKIQVEFNPERVAGYRLVGYENRLLADEDFNDDTKDAGEMGQGHAVTALYEVVPAGLEVPGAGSVDDLRYQPSEDPAGSETPSEFDGELLHVKVRYKEPNGTESRLLARNVWDQEATPSADFRFASAVAGFGMLLRDSEHSGALTLEEVIGLAEEGRGDDPRGYRGEFIRLVEATRDLRLLDEADDDLDPR